MAGAEAPKPHATALAAAEPAAQSRYPREPMELHALRPALTPPQPLLQQRLRRRQGRAKGVQLHWLPGIAALRSGLRRCQCRRMRLRRLRARQGPLRPLRDHARPDRRSGRRSARRLTQRHLVIPGERERDPGPRSGRATGTRSPISALRAPSGMTRERRGQAPTYPHPQKPVPSSPRRCGQGGSRTSRTRSGSTNGWDG